MSSAETGEALFDVPVNLTATDGASLSEINLAWDAVTDVVSYSVHRATIDNFASAVQIPTPGSNSFTDTTAADGVLYYYWVRSSDGAGGFSAEGNPDSGHLLLASPDSLTATLDVTKSVNIAWATVSGANSYGIYRNTSDDSMTSTLVGSSSTTSFSDISAIPGTTYYYWVQALSASGFVSAYSSSVQGGRAVPDPADAFSSWIRTQTTEPALLAFDADADGNGISNGEDFIWPRGNTASATPNGDQASLTFDLRDSAFDDIVIHVDRSIDLVSWTRISSLNPSSVWSGTISLDESTGEGIRTVQMTDLSVEASGSAVFFRVEAEYVELP